MILLSLSLPSPVSSVHLESCGRLFLVHSTRAWWPETAERFSDHGDDILVHLLHLFPPLQTTHHVLLISSPFLKDLQRLTGVQHAWCGKHNLKMHSTVLLESVTFITFLYSMKIGERPKTQDLPWVRGYQRKSDQRPWCAWTQTCFSVQRFSGSSGWSMLWKAYNNDLLFPSAQWRSRSVP